MAGDLHEVELFGFVTTMTAAEVRAFAARLLAMVGDAPQAAMQQALVAETIRQFYPERGHEFVGGPTAAEPGTASSFTGPSSRARPMPTSSRAGASGSSSRTTNEDRARHGWSSLNGGPPRDETPVAESRVKWEAVLEAAVSA